MDNSNSSNEDDEPKICTVFSSAPSNSKSIFDTISFSTPRKETTADLVDPVASSILFSPEGIPEACTSNTLDPFHPISKAGSLISLGADDLQSGDQPSAVSAPESKNLFDDTSATSQSLFYSEGDSPFLDNPNLPIFQNSEDIPASSQIFQTEPQELFVENVIPQDQGQVYSPPDMIFTTPEAIIPVMDNLRIAEEEDEQIIPTAKSLFENTPEVPFPVNIAPPPLEPLVQLSVNTTEPQQLFSPNTIAQTEIGVEILDFAGISPRPEDSYYTPVDPSYEAWIPSSSIAEALKKIQHGALPLPEPLQLTTPGILYDEDFVDKVATNIGLIFGEAEASKRKILTADNVNQNENGLRELIKLGCYRSALNLTKRLLTTYGQGPGRVGIYCKHSPHSLQLWFTRITLLVRIREFATAGAEVEAFKDFDNVDMYYGFYGEAYGEGRTGSLVPFYFRLLAAEIPQYNRKCNETYDRVTSILITVEQILNNLNEGLSEDGSPSVRTPEQLQTSLAIWKKREIRVLYSLANASLFAKDYYNAFNSLTILCRKDPKREPQLKSAIGRLYLQHGDLVSAQKYFQEGADLRSLDSESDQVDSLLDAALAAISQSSYAEALSLYKQALILQPENLTILNNMAVCFLYLGKVKESLALMESTVRQNTPQSLQENVLLNLSSIYELENTDGYKKHSLLKLIGEYKGDGVNLASLKLPNLV